MNLISLVLVVAILFVSISPVIIQTIILKENFTKLAAEQKPKYLETTPSSIKVFYNVYANPANPRLAERYVKEQMSQMLPKHKVFIRSIGARFDIANATRIQHDDSGTELETIKLLWHHCLTMDDASRETVVYIHNKGSFHPKKANDLSRKWLTRAALSKECVTMPPVCDVCSFRMSPLPHPHTPGNMWAARCDYVKKLMDPAEMPTKMAELYHEGRIYDDAAIGAGRFAAEHWVHSHPRVNPCDLSSSRFVWGYDGLPEGEHELTLQRVPRYEKKEYMLYLDEKKRRYTLDHRLVEYKFLYDEIPPPSSFIWKFFGVAPPRDGANLTFS